MKGVDVEALLVDVADTIIERATQMYQDGFTDEQVEEYIRLQVEEAAFARRVLMGAER